MQGAAQKPASVPVRAAEIRRLHCRFKRRKAAIVQKEVKYSAFFAICCNIRLQILMGARALKTLPVDPRTCIGSELRLWLGAGGNEQAVRVSVGKAMPWGRLLKTPDAGLGGKRSEKAGDGRRECGAFNDRHF